jgi:hypothetical protein
MQVRSYHYFERLVHYEVHVGDAQIAFASPQNPINVPNQLFDVLLVERSHFPLTLKVLRILNFRHIKQVMLGAQYENSDHNTKMSLQIAL